MKYQVGDLVLIKACEFKLRSRLHPLPHRVHLHTRRHRLHLRTELFNSFGIIMQAIKHSDGWEGETTSDDNVYVWFSQLDAKQYSFCENEVTAEVIK